MRRGRRRGLALAPLLGNGPGESLHDPLLRVQDHLRALHLHLHPHALNLPRHLHLHLLHPHEPVAQHLYRAHHLGHRVALTLPLRAVARHHAGGRRIEELGRGVVRHPRRDPDPEPGGGAGSETVLVEFVEAARVGSGGVLEFLVEIVVVVVVVGEIEVVGGGVGVGGGGGVGVGFVGAFFHVVHGFEVDPGGG